MILLVFTRISVHYNNIIDVYMLVQAPLGTPILGKDLVICNYPKDQTVLLGAFFDRDATHMCSF